MILDFDDSDVVISDIKYDYNLPTPTENSILLVTTGSFDPFHAGHYNSISMAYTRAVEENYTVVGIVIGTDHDAYVARKNSYRKSLPAKERMVQIRSYLEDNIEVPFDCPIIIDDWMSTQCSRDIQYKRYLNHLEQTTRHKTGYICGSDYIQEIERFKQEGILFVVQRSIMHPIDKYLTWLWFPNWKNIHVINNPVEDISSTEIVKGKKSMKKLVRMSSKVKGHIVGSMTNGVVSLASDPVVHDEYQDALNEAKRILQAEPQKKTMVVMKVETYVSLLTEDPFILS
jgi:nicotinic acid mononucleotide adenylyltransferase